ncbi:MAG: hypothetical protein KatS3mg111_1076 [Pirellulaceae bacterium]|nr:MAG: hypothetical protein KatS3mg111_1076 [Pirellulaceae bacterium]
MPSLRVGSNSPRMELLSPQGGVRLRCDQDCLLLCQRNHEHGIDSWTEELSQPIELFQPADALYVMGSEQQRSLFGNRLLIAAAHWRRKSMRSV